MGTLQPGTGVVGPAAAQIWLYNHARKCPICWPLVFVRVLRKVKYPDYRGCWVDLSSIEGLEGRRVALGLCAVVCYAHVMLIVPSLCGMLRVSSDHQRTRKSPTRLDWVDGKILNERLPARG